MCGIAGYKVLKNGNARKAVEVFEAIMLESQIRGKHATGVSFRWQNQLGSLVRRGPAQNFVKEVDWQWLKDKAKPLEMIGHCRYSTSGEANQPISVNGTAIVHNGLISMATRDEFDKLYGVETETDNDSEIVLRKLDEGWDLHAGEAAFDAFNWNDALTYALKSIYKVNPPIYAFGFLTVDGDVNILRDHLRPLWLFYIKEWNVMGFASTRDIIARAFKKFKDMPEAAIWEAEPYKVYQLGPKVNKAYDIGTMLPLGKVFQKLREGPLPRPVCTPLVAKSWLRNAEATLRGTRLTLDMAKYEQGDHRLNLRESFKRYCAASVKTWEIDPNYPLLQYLFDRYELSEAQQYWVCFLYGVFYHPGTVFYVMQEFPEYEKVDLGRLKRWHEQNWQKLRYNKDRKYEKGHFVEMFESYVSVIGGQAPDDQAKFFQRHFDGTPYDNFHRLWKSLGHLLRFGRYSLYIYTETLARCMGVPIQANTLFLKDSASPRAGLCHVLGKPEWAKAKLSTQDWMYLETECLRLMNEIVREYPDVPMDFWFMESCLCAFKGFFANGRYLGYYLDRMADEISQMQAEDITWGIDWKVLWQFRRENMPWEYLGEYAKPPRLKIVNEWRHVLKNTGKMVGMAPVIRRGLLPKTKVSK